MRGEQAAMRLEKLSHGAMGGLLMGDADQTAWIGGKGQVTVEDGEGTEM